MNRSTGIRGKHKLAEKGLEKEEPERVGNKWKLLLGKSKSKTLLGGGERELSDNRQ